MRLFMLLICALQLSACSMLGTERVRHNKTTSLVNFLYPDGRIPQDLKSPTLRLPLRVGLAYVPGSGRQTGIDSRLKLELLEQVKSSFAAVRYIDRIEVIPELYVSPGGQGAQLDQLRQLYQLDVLALVSYDQLVNRKENLLAVTYLSIVGNYIFPGSHFDVSTLIDLAVIDLDSKRLLFRAAGTHGSKGTSAEAYTRHRYDQHQSQGFATAMHTMIGNLNLELSRFEQRLKAKRPGDDIRVEARPGYQMNSHWWMIILLSLVLWRRRIQQAAS